MILKSTGLSKWWGQKTKWSEALGQRITPIVEFNALFYILWDFHLLWEWCPVKSELLITERKNKNIYYSASVCVNSNFIWSWENPRARLSKPSMSTKSRVKQSVGGHVLSTTFAGAHSTCRIWHRDDWGTKTTGRVQCIFSYCRWNIWVHWSIHLASWLIQQIIHWAPTIC